MILRCLWAVGLLIIAGHCTAKPLKLAMSGAFQPFSTTDSSGELTGFDADIALEIARRMQRKPELVQTDWSGIQAGLQSQKYDLICGSMAITPKRSETMLFSLPYYVSGAQIFARKGIDSLKNLRIGVTEDSTYAHWIQQHPQRFADSSVTHYGSEAEIIMALKTQKIDAFVSDRIVGGFYIQKAGAKQIRPLGDLLYEEACGISARLKSTDLIEEVNIALFSMIQDGTYSRIYQKWVGMRPELDRLLLSWSRHSGTLQSQAATQEGSAAASKSFVQGFKGMLPLLLDGLWLTLQLTLITAVFSLLFGIALGVLGVSQTRLFCWPVTAYTYLVRGTPLLVQLFISYFVVATLINQWFGFEAIDAYLAALLALILNTSAYNAETIRGGILAVDQGQWEAARALGMPRFMLLKRIILPQALQTVIPSLANNLVVLIKDTSLVGAVTLVELTYAARSIVFQTGEAVLPFFLAGGFYLILIVLLLSLIRRLERSAS